MTNPAKITLKASLEKNGVIYLDQGHALTEPPVSKPEPEQSLSRPRSFLALSFVLLALLPIGIASFFWMEVASDRYVSSAGFAVRSMGQGGNSSLLGSLGGASSGARASDSRIVMAYLESRAMVEKIEETKPFTQMFSSKKIDPLYRMPKDWGIEKRVEYWQDRLQTSYDSNSGILTFDVEAFSRKDAFLLSQIVLGQAKEIVNQLSESARRNAVSSAEKEVRRSENRLLGVRESMRKFRVEYGDVDPVATAAAQRQIDTKIEAEIIDSKARISVLTGKVSSNSRPLTMLLDRVDSLEQQLVARKTETDPHKGALAKRLEKYEKINVEEKFAQKAYTTAMSSLEKARVLADGQQQYLAVFLTPYLPEVAVLPSRLTNILLTAICIFALWGIGTLIVYSTRDHMA